MQKKEEQKIINTSKHQFLKTDFLFMLLFTKIELQGEVHLVHFFFLCWDLEVLRLIGSY